MNTKRLIGCLLALALCAVPALAADLTIWHAYRGNEKAAFEKLVAEFNKAYAAKGIKAATLAVPYDAFADKITASVPRGKGPDIVIFAQDRLGGWIEAGNTIAPIDFFLDKDTKARYIPSTMDAMTYKGSVYGLPFNYKAVTMIYNKKLVPTPPKTSTELIAMAKKLTDPASGRFGLAYTYADFYYHSALMNAFGGAVFDKQRKPTIDTPQNIKSLELMMKWADKDKVLPAEASSVLISQLFNSGKAAIVFNGPWFLGEIDKSVDFGLAPLPKIDEAGGQPMKPWTTIEGLYIAAPSKNQEAAYEFVKFATDLAGAKIMALEGRQTPSNAKIYDDPAVAADPILKAFRAQVENSVPMPNYAEMAMFWSPVTTAMNALTRKSATPAAAMAQAQKEVLERIASLRKSP